MIKLELLKPGDSVFGFEKITLLEQRVERVLQITHDAVNVCDCEKDGDTDCTCPVTTGGFQLNYEWIALVDGQLSTINETDLFNEVAEGIYQVVDK